MHKANRKVGEKQRRVRATLPLSSLLELNLSDAEEYLCDATEKDKVSISKSIVTLHKQFLADATATNRHSVDRYVAFLNIFGDLVDYGLATFLLIEVTSYFENIGEASKALNIAVSALTRAKKSSDQRLERKAHNRLGVCYSRLYDFEPACQHFETGLRLAVALNERLYEFALLSNIVTLFDAMGLLSEAKILALKLTAFPEGTDDLNGLHLQNAINGFRLAHQLDDRDTMHAFYNIAKAKIGLVKGAPEPWGAHFDANHAIYLLSFGKPIEAQRYLGEAVLQQGREHNVRARVTLLIAQVDCALAASDWSSIDEFQRRLSEILPSVQLYPLDYEAVLYSLVRICIERDSVASKQLGSIYLRQLHNHLVNVKYREFFSKISSSAIDNKDGFVLTNPRYTVSLSLPVEAKSYDPLCQQSINELVLDGPLEVFESTCARPLVRSDELGLRNSVYRVAENWAVAAEFSDGRSGKHCFQVGSLAAGICASLGLSRLHCIAMELACRLHDIGKVAVSPNVLAGTKSGRLDPYHCIREHTEAGHKLLCSSDDAVLQLGARIARHHHEWWNGCGLPDAVSGVAIPLEARICAIADAYVSLTCTGHAQPNWSHDEAVRQISAMMGFQFDPGLLSPFLQAVDTEHDMDSASSQRTEETLLENQLAIAVNSLRKQLSSV